MRICIVKSTSKLVEMQSDATAGTLINNAISAGYNAEDIEEREVTSEEYQVIFDNQPIPLDELKTAKLCQIDSWTAQHITDGFVSSAMGMSHTYDSEQVDQDNIKLMHAASLSPNFETDSTYQGHVPIRAIPAGQTAKIVLMHDKAQLQALIDDMARHIGYCKQIGWQLQAAATAATTKDELGSIVWPE